MKDDPKREDIRLAGVLVQFQGFRGHVERGADIDPIEHGLLLAVRRKPEIPNFPQIAHLHDVGWLEVSVQNLPAK